MNKPLLSLQRPVDCPCGGAALAARGGSTTKAPRFAQCCGRYIDGGEAAPRALELMRSRYSAYVLGATAYLRATWDPRTCPADLDVDPAASDAPRWLGLQIKAFAESDADHATVEFIARYKVGGRAHRLHELSRFLRGGDGRWRYVDGDVNE
ncbi:YchJ family protein [Paraburkholderia atlantica]|uniref:YchJ family protein n=1 Tax=Paraburkholderia atlantica TaxID=2654982 RepID=UPI0016158BC7|nr:YchJ family protein [Paraburkholderia atlantica]MBB5509476.1 SEC-C motif-containing protein [Paraburkholderia atlantica]